MQLLPLANGLTHAITVHTSSHTAITCNYHQIVFGCLDTCLYFFPETSWNRFKDVKHVTLIRHLWVHEGTLLTPPRQRLRREHAQAKLPRLPGTWLVVTWRGQHCKWIFFPWGRRDVWCRDLIWCDVVWYDLIFLLFIHIYIHYKYIYICIYIYVYTCVCMLSVYTIYTYYSQYTQYHIHIHIYRYIFMCGALMYFGYFTWKASTIKICASTSCKFLSEFENVAQVSTTGGGRWRVMPSSNGCLRISQYL